jgi:hypothetical protein
MSSSETGPAVMPSGGLLVRARYSWTRRRWAVEDAMFVRVVWGGGRKGRKGSRSWGKVVLGRWRDG